MSLDELLRPFITPDETAADLYKRTWTEPIPVGIPFLPYAKVGQIVEVCGPTSCGKSTFLIQAAAKAILQREHDGVYFGGAQENAVFIDLDNKFDVVKLMEILHESIVESFQAVNRQTDASVVDSVMEHSLHRFHLVRCGNSFEFLACLRTLAPFVLGLQEGMRILLIDNVAAFHWLDAAVRQVPQQGGTIPHSTLTLQTVHKVAAASIKMLARQLKLAVLLSKHNFRTPSGHVVEEDWSHKEVMSAGWDDLINQRILLRCISGGVGDLPLKLGAKMHKPPGNPVFTFAIGQKGLVESSW